MTKTEIVNQISENTGISKKEVAIVVESYEDRQGEPSQQGAHISAWFRKLHYQAPCREDSSQHTEEYYRDYSRSRLPQLQAG